MSSNTIYDGRGEVIGAMSDETGALKFVASNPAYRLLERPVFTSVRELDNAITAVAELALSRWRDGRVG